MSAFASRSPGNTEFQVGPETFVTLSFRVQDAEGEWVGPEEVSGFVFGLGQLLPSVEAALEMHVAGEELWVEVPSREGFGRRKADSICEFDRSEFPPDIKEGDRFELENEAGALLVSQVLEVGEDFVVLDLNHPLCEQDLKIKLAILEVRPATEAEIEAAQADFEEARALEDRLEGQAMLEGQVMEAAEAEAKRPDVGLSRLIKGSRRG